MGDKLFTAIVLICLVLNIVLSGWIGFEVGHVRERIEILEGIQAHFTLYTPDEVLEDPTDIEEFLGVWLRMTDAKPTVYVEDNRVTILLDVGGELKSVVLVANVDLPKR